MGTVNIDEKGLVVTCPTCGQKNRRAFERLEDASRCGQCKTPLDPVNTPVDIRSTADFDRLVARSSLPVVVDYWAPWCGPCRMVAPELEKVAARRAGRLVVAKVNTDEVSELGHRFGIRSIPTMAVFVDGREATRSAGARPAAEIEAMIDSVPVGHV